METRGNKDEIVITRTFDAPRSLVWKAWTDPELLKKWWGPKYFTSPAAKIDLRVGGRFLGCMRGPDGRDYWSTGTYREIVPNERLVVTDSFADEQGTIVPASRYGMAGDWPMEQLVTVMFDERDNRTRMTLRHEGIPAGLMREMTGASWNESFDKLAESIVTEGTRIVAERGKQEVVITRSFNAPRNFVFKAYTDPYLVPNWWGPKRFTTVIDRLDLQPGGRWRFVQRDAGGNMHAFHGVYHEVRSPERLVATFEYEGAPGHVSLDTVMFEEIGGRTKVTEKTVFQSVEDRDEMIREGMEEGVYESMDRLGGLLEAFTKERKAA